MFMCKWARAWQRQLTHCSFVPRNVEYWMFSGLYNHIVVLPLLRGSTGTRFNHPQFVVSQFQTCFEKLRIPIIFSPSSHIFTPCTSFFYRCFVRKRLLSLERGSTLLWKTASSKMNKKWRTIFWLMVSTERRGDRGGVNLTNNLT